MPICASVSTYIILDRSVTCIHYNLYHSCDSFSMFSVVSVCSSQNLSVAFSRPISHTYNYGWHMYHHANVVVSLFRVINEIRQAAVNDYPNKYKFARILLLSFGMRVAAAAAAVVVVVVVVVVSLVLHLDVFRCCYSLLFFPVFSTWCVDLFSALFSCSELREVLFSEKRISLILHSILIIAYGFGYSKREAAIATKTENNTLARSNNKRECLQFFSQNAFPHFNIQIHGISVCSSHP